LPPNDGEFDHEQQSRQKYQRMENQCITNYLAPSEESHPNFEVAEENRQASSDDLIKVKCEGNEDSFEK